MDYDVVRTSVQSAYKNFGQNDNKFYSAMSDFYKEGKKNPSVARIIMQDYVTKCRKAAKQLLNDAAALSFQDQNLLAYSEMHAAQRGIYSLALVSALKSVSAEDMYKNSEALSDDIYIENSKEFNAKWNELYPKTHKTRERIIESNRLSADKVTARAGWFEKINFAKTLEEYKKLYPKTFFARYWLVMNNQIKEDEVTYSVKNIFKRFGYKRLIKEGFCFKK